MAEVIIGVDPHKLSATIEIVDRQERLVATGRFSTDQVPQNDRGFWGLLWRHRFDVERCGAWLEIP